MDTQNKTILYYTANTEDPIFEQKIRDDIKKKARGIPIISVSRKPIDFGTNICVGEKPVSYTSEWKQLLIGLKAATTKYVIAAEADCLYPEEYFSFTPTDDRMMYNYDNIYIVWKFKNGFYKKRGFCEGAQMCGREYWIERLEPLLPESWEPYTRLAENMLVTKIFPTRRVWSGNPIISFKTRDGVSYRTTFVNDKLKEIPYWGQVEPLKVKFFGN